jgi:hypothetical protein
MSFAANRDEVANDETLVYDLQVAGKLTRCYVFESDKSEDFMSWWESTRWHFLNDEKSRKVRKNIEWGSTKRKAEEWKEFQEGATVSDDNPKLICLRCVTVLTHSSLGFGNNFMSNHLIFDACKKTSVFKGLKQLPLKMGYRAEVIITTTTTMTTTIFLFAN